MTSPSNASALRAYWLKELRSLLRDRNITVYGFLLPLFLYPFLLFGVTELRTVTKGLREHIRPVVAIEGMPELVAHLESLPERPRVVPISAGGPGETLRRGDADLVLLASKKGLEICYDASSGASTLARDKLVEKLEEWRRMSEASLLRGERGMWQLAEPQLVDTSAGTSTTQVLLAMLLPLILIVMCTFGATWPALELTAGERERQTAETTFLLPLARTDIALCKTLAVAAAAFVTMSVHLVAMVIAAGPLLAELRGGSVTLPSLAWQTLPLILCYGALLSLVFGSIFLLAGSYARTFREAQAFVTPLQLLMMLPAMLTLLPDAQLDATTAWIPIYNAGLAFRAALLGEMNTSSTMISLLSLGICGLLCFRATVRRLTDTAFALGFTDNDRVMESTL